MAEKVELVSPFGVLIEGEDAPTFVTRNNIEAMWPRLSAEDKAHNLQRGNVRVHELTPEQEAFFREASREKTMDEGPTPADLAAGRSTKRRRGGGEA